MAAPPTLVAFADATAVVATTVAVTTASLTWLTGDVVVVFGSTEGGNTGETLTAPTTTGTGISFGAAQQVHNSAGADCGGGVWAAVTTGGSSGTFSFSATWSGGASTRTLVVSAYIFRGSGGIGNSAILPVTGTNTARTVSLTPTAADCAVAWYVADWHTDAAVAFTPAATSHDATHPGPVASPHSQVLGTSYTSYVADLDDQTSSTAVPYGIGGTGTGPFTIVAIEVKAAGNVDATATPGAVARAAAGLVPSVGSLTSPATAGTAADLGGGQGSWSNVTNAQGGDDGTVATWAVP